ncbi:aminotransferase class IV [Pseudoruegeria sp. SHC-113]|nr:aminotransferase class IV [Pseudoruegeria sp. SHC-113]
MGWHHGEGVRFMGLHLDRMCDSARALGIPFARREMHAALEGVESDAPLRLRLSMGLDGAHRLERFPLPPTPARWRLGLAEARLEARDPWRGHKTSERQIYDTARAALPLGVDELLFLNTRGACAEGTITNLFVAGQGGALLTPPLSAGVLPGVLRRHLIETGRARVAPLLPRHLMEAEAIYMGNALRGLIPCDLAEDFAA